MEKTLSHPITTIPSIEGIKYRSSIAKKSVWRAVRSWIRRSIIVILNLLLNHDWVFGLIGMVNKRVKLINSVFLMYPANDEYAMAYVFRSRLPKVEWNPWPVGLFYQNGKFGVKFVISANNGQYRDPDNDQNMRHVVARMEYIRQLFCAERKTFAGILPGVLYFKRMIRETHEVEVTVKAVLQAIERVRTDEGLPSDTPIIVLGGRGFIGRKVVVALPKESVYSVDIAGGNGRDDWPTHLKGQRVLLVNIALNSALDGYLDMLWPEMILLNEVYPEPSAETSHRLHKLGCHCYHIMGVKAAAFPLFPLAYRGGIPCCAAWPSQKMEVRLLRIT